MRRLLRDWRFYIGLTMCSIAGSLFWGPYAAAGLSLGILGTFASVFGTWAAVKLMTKGVENGAKPGFGGFVLGLLFLIKLPVFLLAAYLASRLPDPGLPSFGVGILLVYSALTGWAQAKA